MSEQSELGKSGMKRTSIFLILVLFWLPFGTILVIDFLGRVDSPISIFAALSGKGATANVMTARTTGDLVRMAGVPFIRDALGPGQMTTVVNNREGYRDTEESLNGEAEVVICGASFASHGSDLAHTLTGTMRKLTERKLQNCSLPGNGPTAALVRYFSKPSNPNPNAKILVWCVIERDLTPTRLRAFAKLNLNESPENIREQLKKNERRRRSFSITRKFDYYYKFTSVSRRLLTHWGAYVPPTCFDRGLGSMCRLYRLGAGEDIMMAFYRPSLLAHRGAFRLPDGPLVRAGIANLNALIRARGMSLLVVLIPDKFTIYGEGAVPQVVDNELSQLQVNTGHLSQIEEAFRQCQVPVVNLQEPLLKAAKKRGHKELLYYVGDSHWNDDGIRVGAQVIAKAIDRLWQSLH